MSKYFYIATIVVAMAISAAIAIQARRIAALRIERDRYADNTDALLRDVLIYKTSDSLNAAKVGELRLRLGEFEKYRAADAATIRSLQLKLRDIQAVTTLQSETIIETEGVVYDTVIIRDFQPPDTLRHVTAGDAWFSIDGYIDYDNVFKCTLQTRDSLLIAESVEYRRFLGFLWRTKRIKNRDFHVVSKSPYTKIIDFEVVSIEN